MAEIFRAVKENTAARCDHRARILKHIPEKLHDFSDKNMRRNEVGAEKIAKPAQGKILMLFNFLQSPELVLLRPGRRRAKLTVFTPRRFALARSTCNWAYPAQLQTS
jgi:hypothetical protein